MQFFGLQQIGSEWFYEKGSLEAACQEGAWDDVVKGEMG
jgi:hypothetical protein